MAVKNVEPFRKDWCNLFKHKYKTVTFLFVLKKIVFLIWEETIIETIEKFKSNKIL